MSKRIFNVLLVFCLFAGLIMHPIEVRGQIGNTIKIAGKAGAKALMKKTTKEVAEDAVKQAAKKAAEKKAAEELAKGTAKRITMKVTTTLLNGVKDFSGYNAAKELAKLSSRKSAETAAKRIGTKEVCKAAEESIEDKMKREATRKAGKVIKEEGAEKTGKEAVETGVKRATEKMIGKEALDALNDYPEIQKLVRELREKKGPLFDVDNLVVEKGSRGTTVSFRNTKTSMTIDGNKIKARSGSIQHTVEGGKSVMDIEDGQLNEFLRNPLPNKKYEVDNLMTFETDELGRTVSVETNSSDLYKHMKNSKIEHGKIDNGARNGLAEKYGVSTSTHDYGHLTRRELGGINEEINALPMKNEFQRSGSDWYEFEAKEIKACENNQQVKSRMKIKYLENGKYEIEVEKIIDGESTKMIFTDLI